jgi:hypothetical protein
VAFVARAVGWAAAAGLLLAGGLLAVGWLLLAIQGPGYSGLGDVQQLAFKALYRAILLQALLPQACAALVLWLGFTAFVPALDATWKRLAPGLAVAAALCFPIAARGFAIWNPTGARDVVATFALLTASVALALLIPRTFPSLGTGVFWSKIPSDS